MKSQLFEIPVNMVAEEDLPRNKVLMKGKASLTNKEILATIISLCSRQGKSLEISGRLLARCEQNLNTLAEMSIEDLMKTPGIGKGTASAIIASFELGNRKKSQTNLRTKISGSRDLFEFIEPFMSNLQYECFYVVLINRGNRIIRALQISEGGVSGTVADPKRIFKMALDHNASSLILCHNHPSGNTQPSEADIRLTRKLKEAGLLLDLPVLDHLIVSSEGYYSFADEGLL